MDAKAATVLNKFMTEPNPNVMAFGVGLLRGDWAMGIVPF